MADLTREELHRLARLGAKARLEELRKEEAAIRRAFPDLFGVARQASTGNGAPRRKRKPMTDAQKAIVSERMKKYWAAKRKTKK
jgi:hypothetical protein